MHNKHKFAAFLPQRDWQPSVLLPPSLAGCYNPEPEIKKKKRRGRRRRKGSQEKLGRRGLLWELCDESRVEFSDEKKKKKKWWWWCYVTLMAWWSLPWMGMNEKEKKENMILFTNLKAIHNTYILWWAPLFPKAWLSLSLDSWLLTLDPWLSHRWSLTLWLLTLIDSHWLLVLDSWLSLTKIG